jgi:hypothetical protein
MPQHIKEKEKINGVSSAATAMGGGTEQGGMTPLKKYAVGWYQRREYHNNSKLQNRHNYNYR